MQHCRGGLDWLVIAGRQPAVQGGCGATANDRVRVGQAQGQRSGAQTVGLRRRRVDPLQDANQLAFPDGPVDLGGKFGHGATADGAARPGDGLCQGLLHDGMVGGGRSIPPDGQQSVDGSGRRVPLEMAESPDLSTATGPPTAFRAAVGAWLSAIQGSGVRPAVLSQRRLRA